jgi:hypothetical protein
MHASPTGEITMFNSRSLILSIAAIAFAAGAIALATFSSTAQDAQPPSEQEFQLPEGWTMEDMMVFAEAGTPGPMHELLAEGVGRWQAETTMWMAPDTDPIMSKGHSVVTPIMGGRFIKVEMTGEMPGMGTYNGFGIYGYDNTTKQFQAIWIDNHSTGMMRGTGKLAEDKKGIEWDFTYTCPLRKQPATLHEIERVTGENTRTLEMHGSDAKTGVEFKMLEIKFTRASDAR